MDAYVEGAKRALKQFLERDYQEDQKRLNALLAAPGRSSAEFIEDMSPLPFAGNPFDPALRGKCVALLGINPKWLGWDHSLHAPREYLPLRQAVDALRAQKGSLEDFIGLRADYFTSKNDYFYGTYYTRLGNLFGRRWFATTMDRESDRREKAKAVLRSHILKSDILPWFSRDTNSIAPNRLNTPDEALTQYKGLLRALLRLAQPRWIQFNGRQALPFIENVLECNLLPMQVANETGPMTINVGWCTNLEITDKPIPVLVHGFTSSASGPQSQIRFDAVAAQFESWVGEKSRFVF